MTYQAVKEWVMVINGSTLISTTEILVFSIIKPSKSQSNLACLSKQKNKFNTEFDYRIGVLLPANYWTATKTHEMQQWKVSVIAYHAIW